LLGSRRTREEERGVKSKRERKRMAASGERFLG
jgi:hypothetical protein